jgi:predicted ATPase/DNA-binding CsgD family transcriptional regulator
MPSGASSEAERERGTAAIMPLPVLVPVSAQVPNLPRPLTSIVGREREVAALTDLLRGGQARLLVVTGPGGVGKTRLAVEVGWALADEFADGVVFVSLAAIRGPALVAETIARAVAAPERGSLAENERLVGALRDRRTLLVIDNFEHVAGAASLMNDLLQACPGLTLLVASRSRLRLAGEHDYPLSPLPLPPLDPLPPLGALRANPALRLFCARAAEVLPSFALTADNAATISAICRRLDGLPLAIELAAARMRAIAPRDLLTRLSREPGGRSATRLRLLSGGPVDAPDRLSGLREAIAWSYDLLSPTDQRLLRCLGAFAGGCALEAAEYVASPSSPSVVDGLTELVDQSLVRFEPSGPGGARYDLLATIRAFALEELDASGEADGVRERLTAWCAALADEARPATEQTGRGPWFDRLELELGNLREALGWLRDRADGHRGLRLTTALGHFFMIGRRFDEFAGWLGTFLAASAAGAPMAERGWALVRLADLEQTRGRPERVFPLAEEARAIFASLADRRGEAAALENLATAAHRTDQPERAVELYEQCIAISRELGNADDAAVTQLRLATTLRSVGRGDEAIPLLVEAISTLRDLGSTGNIWLAFGLGILGLTYLLRHDLARAGASYAEALTLALEMDDRFRIADCLFDIGEIAHRRGELVRASRLFGAAAAQLSELGISVDQEAIHGTWIAEVRRQLGKASFARAWEAGAAAPIADGVAAAQAVVTAAQQTAGKRRPAQRDELELSAREREVLGLLVEGRSDREIAAALGISPRTAETHVFRLCAKLGVESRTAAVTAAFRLGFA